MESEATRQSEISCSLPMGTEALTFTSLARRSNTAIPSSHFMSPRGVSTDLRRELRNSPTKLILIHFDLNFTYGLCRQSSQEWKLNPVSTVDRSPNTMKRPPNSPSQTVWGGRSLGVSSRRGRCLNYGENSPTLVDICIS